MIQSKIIQNDLRTATKNSLKNELKSNVNDHYSTDDAENDAIENWKGLGEPEKKKKKVNYVDKDPSVLYYNENSRTKSQVIGILRNGNCSDLMPIKIDGTSYSLLNTCPFDSVFQILCTAYVDNSEYAQFINSKIEEDLMFKTVAHAIRDGINAQTYIRRGTLLKSLHKPKQCSEYLVTINCATTVGYIIKELFKCYPSYEEEITCTSCKTYYTRKQNNIS